MVSSTSIKSLGVFFCYSTRDKEIVGTLKTLLDSFLCLLTTSKTPNGLTKKLVWQLAPKFIIPIQVDFPPYGFVGKIESLRINEYLIDTAKEIVKVIRNKSKFGKDMNNFIIYAFINSKNFEQANDRARLLEDIKDFVPDQVNQIVNATRNNTIIQRAYVAQRVLRPIFTKYKSNITDDEYKQLMELL